MDFFRVFMFFINDNRFMGSAGTNQYIEFFKHKRFFKTSTEIPKSS